jgi:hypothetical protein
MIRFLRKNPALAAVIAVLLVLAAASFFLIRSAAKPDPMFGWNESTPRELSKLGVNSSEMRLGYGYIIDRDSYYPSYSKKSTSCTVLGKYDSKPMNPEADERQASYDFIASYTGQPVGDVRSQVLKYGNIDVPVGMISYDDEESGKFYNVISRWFKQENVRLTVLTTCSNEGDRNNAVKEVLKSFVLNDKSSDF